SPRANLVRPRRSSPSPEARHIRGGDMMDNGEWTEVRRRRRKEFREADRGHGRSRQSRRYRSRSLSIPRDRFFHDWQFWNQPNAWDHDHHERFISRYGMEGDRDASRHGSHHHWRWNSDLQHHDARSKQQIEQRQQDYAERRRREAFGDRRRYCDSGNRGRVSRNRVSRWEEEDNVSHGSLQNQHVQGPKVNKDKHVKGNSVHKDQLVQGANNDQLVQGNNVKLGSDLKRYVSFYFTNFPAQLSNFYLRKGFEVCGMLEDVYVPKKRNKYGEPYGFVRFSNVRDVTKLMRALNAVFFGHYRVRARVASFDRNDKATGRRPETEKLGLMKEGEGLVKEDGNNKTARPVMHKGVDDRNATTGTKAKRGDDTVDDSVKGGFGS
ncbi:RNA recognition motif, partial [Trifolium medium]|nr:RNA recognition motif [Trifolium medium]